MEQPYDELDFTYMFKTSSEWYNTNVKFSCGNVKHESGKLSDGTAWMRKLSEWYNINQGAYRMNQRARYHNLSDGL